MTVFISREQEEAYSRLDSRAEMKSPKRQETGINNKLENMHESTVE